MFLLILKVLFINEAVVSDELLVEYATFSLKRVASKVNIFKWWDQHRLKFPKLYVAAYIMLLIKPSSTECERTFSRSARFMTKYRASMHPDTMDRLIYCNGNVNFFERALQVMGANWRPTNKGRRTIVQRRREDSLANLSIDLENLVFNTQVIEIDQ